MDLAPDLGKPAEQLPQPSAVRAVAFCLIPLESRDLRAPIP
jgi:hypothetical protein